MSQRSPKTNRIYVESRPVPAQGPTFKSLMFRYLLPEDSGIYTCKAGDLSASIIIFVVEKAVLEEEEHNYNVIVRQSIELACVAKGLPTPQIRWYKDNTVEPIVTNLKYTVTYDSKASTSLLKINDLNYMDPVTYRCRATQEPISHFAEKIYRLKVQQRKLLM